MAPRPMRSKALNSPEYPCPHTGTSAGVSMATLEKADNIGVPSVTSLLEAM
jgi:hypothetical protein